MATYKPVLIHRPMLARCGIAALLFGTGDTQQLIKKKGLRRHDADFIHAVELKSYSGVTFVTDASLVI
ncbi:hypothetical protein EDD85DRAFT_945965 [Armillaria nabsnona]|nr:hypothetical protein EDD85DRAFT_963188 [Armillaria nabsnona]KAK0244639.1 hypothetical protein EDD85DRAFT_945965 [Armillaria nabsnona]